MKYNSSAITKRKKMTVLQIFFNADSFDIDIILTQNPASRKNTQEKSIFVTNCVELLCLIIKIIRK